MTEKEMNKLSKEFRHWLREATEDNPEPEAQKKAEFRAEKSSESGWLSVGFTGPRAAVEDTKAFYADFKKHHPTLWDDADEPSKD